MKVAFALEEIDRKVIVNMASLESIEILQAAKQIDAEHAENICEPMSVEDREVIDKACEQRDFQVLEIDDCNDGISRECEVFGKDGEAVNDKAVLTKLFLDIGLVQNEYYSMMRSYDGSGR